MAGPHRLAQGDRLLIGRYVVGVSIEDERAETGHPQARTGSTQRELPSSTGRPRDPGHEPYFNPAGQRPRGAPVSTSSALQPGPSVPANRPAEADAMLREIAKAAGLAPELLQSRDPHDVAAEIGAFVDAVEKGVKPEAGFEDGRQALILAEAANRSIAEGRTIPVRDIG